MTKLMPSLGFVIAPITMDNADWTRFGEFMNAHLMACGAGEPWEIEGSEEVTILRCPKCKATVEADFDVDLFMSGFKASGGSVVA
jgi:hypothetical protein